MDGAATIGAAAVVTRDIPPDGTVIGVNNLLKRRAATSPSPQRRVIEEPNLAQATAPAAAPAASPSKPLPFRLSIQSSGLRDAYESRMEYLAETTESLDDPVWFYDREKAETVEEGTYNMFGI